MLNRLFPQKSGAPKIETVEWIDVVKIDDNPFQPRGAILEKTPQMEKFIRTLNTEGQIEAAGVRPHPDPAQAKAGYFQQIWGHRRAYAVRYGANAGANKPNPAQYVGLLRCEIIREPLTDLQMATLALSENIARENLNPLEQARGFQFAFDLVRTQSGAGKMEAWTRVARETKLSYQHMTRMAYILELPEMWQARFVADENGVAPDDDADAFRLNGTHVRALYTLRDWPDHQKTFWAEMLRSEWGGTVALKRAEELARGLKTRQPTLAQEAESQEAQEQRKADSRRAIEENRAKLESGAPVHLQAVPKDGAERSQTANGETLGQRIAAMNKGPVGGEGVGDEGVKTAPLFAVGDRVAWTGQDGKEKIGFIVKLLPGGKVEIRRPDLRVGDEFRIVRENKLRAAPATSTAPPSDPLSDIERAAQTPATTGAPSRDFKDLSKALSGLAETVSYIESISTGSHGLELKPGEGAALTAQIRIFVRQLLNAHAGIGEEEK